jgi:hypothetical protein
VSAARRARHVVNSSRDAARHGRAFTDAIKSNCAPQNKPTRAAPDAMVSVAGRALHGRERCADATRYGRAFTNAINPIGTPQNNRTRSGRSGPDGTVSAARRALHVREQLAAARRHGRAFTSATNPIGTAQNNRTRSRPEGSPQSSSESQRSIALARTNDHPDQTRPAFDYNAHGSEFHCAPQRPRWARPNERSAAAELSSSSTARTRPQPFGAQPRCCAQRSAHGNSPSGVATSASPADASSPLI